MEVAGFRLGYEGNDVPEEFVEEMNRRVVTGEEPAAFHLMPTQPARSETSSVRSIVRILREARRRQPAAVMKRTDVVGCLVADYFSVHLCCDDG